MAAFFRQSPYLPPELITYVVDWVTRSDLTKHELGLCSLTCRYWARRCRPLVFQKLKLESPDDARTLLEYVHRPGSDIAVWMKSLILVQKEPSYPWTHLIYLRFSAKIPQLVEITHILQGPKHDPSETQRPRRIHSLHPSIPKSLPSLYNRCSRAHLDGLHLRSFSNFIHLVGTLNACTSLWCTDVSWFEQAEPTRRIALRAGKRRIMRDILLNNCTDVWVYTWLCVATDPRKTPDVSEKYSDVPYIRLDESQRLAQCVRPIFGSHKCGKLRDEPSATGFSLSITCEEEVKCAPDVRIHVNRTGSITSVAFLYSGMHGPELSLQDALLFRTSQCDWDGLDQALSKCLFLNEFLVDFCAKEDFVHAIMPKIAEKLPGSRNILRVRYRKPSNDGSLIWQDYSDKPFDSSKALRECCFLC
ncbi:hypothetical protein BDY19DRAFT_994099 [Irpex rosettiformis]|uniref:Uncharacterized protein n=1 Tax=Irpex rosettiformis TaxID=378272 RepID=A0ACB8U1K1_9APHY|nr:hypothetical protein BDY19DRAFT_994099 [Irpex rosettiformis]